MHSRSLRSTWFSPFPSALPSHVLHIIFLCLKKRSCLNFHIQAFNISFSRQKWRWLSLDNDTSKKSLAEWHYTTLLWLVIVQLLCPVHIDLEVSCQTLFPTKVALVSVLYQAILFSWNFSWPFWIHPPHPDLAQSVCFQHFMLDKMLPVNITDLSSMQITLTL